ncbi:hypothetical protein [Streptomyces sp. NBC_01497]|uniref:hypothetical protein n=1 Tax=Streptomyces sp. NBC_01497 TaxID=2903885 RepID=UPI002E303F37|nr:hypothetical protein [Streptomyces sp. NBC_01497]
MTDLFASITATGPVDTGSASGTAGGSAPCRTVDLAPYVNNIGVSTADDTSRGSFNVWGNSFPAEFLPGGPAGREPVSVGGVPYVFPRIAAGDDNVRCDGQFVPVPPGRYDWLHVLAASERRAEDVVEMHFEDGGVDAEWLRVSDFWVAPAWFGETEAYRTPVMHYPHHVQRHVQAAMWSQRIPVTRRSVLTGFRLPPNAAVHVFAATLQESATPPQRPVVRDGSVAPHTSTENPEAGHDQ